MTMWSPYKAQWDDKPEDEDVYYKTVINSDGKTVTEEKPIESKGYEILKDDTIKCADCGIKLIDIIKVKEDETKKKVITARCPCGGESFLYIIEGETYLQASEGKTIINMPTEIKDDIVHMTIEVL